MSAYNKKRYLSMWVRWLICWKLERFFTYIHKSFIYTLSEHEILSLRGFLMNCKEKFSRKYKIQAKKISQNYASRIGFINSTFHNNTNLQVKHQTSNNLANIAKTILDFSDIGDYKCRLLFFEIPVSHNIDWQYLNFFGVLYIIPTWWSTLQLISGPFSL